MLVVMVTVSSALQRFSRYRLSLELRTWLPVAADRCFS